MSNSSPLLRWLCVILTICLSIGFASFKLLAPVMALAMAVFICAVLWIVSPALAPPGAGAVKVRLASIFCFFALAMPRSWIGDALGLAAQALAGIPGLGGAVPWLARLDWSSQASEWSLTLGAVVVVMISLHMSEKPLAGRDTTALSKQFPDLTFKSRYQQFCRMLLLDLEKIENELSWSQGYAELEAEVETAARIGHPGGRVVNLQAALRAENKAKVFLLLGDPGGGKSFALRKLARDMLAEVKVSRRVPVYINLREWLPPGDGPRWSEQHPPTLEQLDAFVIGRLKSQGNVVDKEFIDEYFHELRKHGRLFFIFDSFDEIPELLDADENSWLIGQLSDLFSRYIRSHENARGLLASRMFRRPTHLFAAEKTLEIRPLSEVGIQQAMSHHIGFTEAIQKQLLHERPDWLPVVRNPFMMALLAQWVRAHDKLPDNQEQLYRHYFADRLKRATDHTDLHGLSVDQVLAATKQIACFVFDHGAYGLEAPRSLLEVESKIPQVGQVIDILCDAVIGRVGTAEPHTFSFVHRRFLEYLVTTRMLAQPGPPPFQTILDDSRGRDATVLYAQLCDDASAAHLARRCWKEIETHLGKPDDRSGIHSLRFLIDAFRSRRTALAAFAPALSKLVSEQAIAEDDIVRSNICLEATGLLDNDDAVVVLHLAMAGPNDWLRTTAFRACRHLPALSDKLRQSINHYLVKMPALQFWRERKALLLSLALSEPLDGTHRLARWRQRGLVASVVAVLAGAALVPKIAAIFLLSAVYLAIVDLLSVQLALTFTQKKSRKPNVSTGASMFAPGTLFRLHQQLMAVALVALASWTLFTGETATLARLAPIAALLPAHLWPALATSLLVLGLLSLDWISAIHIVHAYRGFMALSGKERIKLLAKISGLCAAVPIGAIILVTLLRLIPPDMQKLVADTMGHALAAALLVFGGFTVIQHVRERRALPALLATIGGDITRVQIVTAMGAVKLPRNQMAVVAKLAEQKTSPSGAWPDGFTLNPRCGPALTELAKLEARWRKLDR